MRTSETLNLTDLIKKQTRQAHVETEQLLIPKLKAIKTIADYAAILKMFYGFFHPLEKNIENFITQQQLPDIGKRRKSDSIINDLQLIGFSQQLLLCNDLPIIKNVAQAFGALYVLEGSTLGGRHIAAMLKNNTHVFLQDDVLSFFIGYGDRNYAMWEQFRNGLNEQITSGQQQLKVMEAANETFLKLKCWLQNF